MKKSLTLDVIVTTIIMMWLYASFSKYFDFGQFKRGMYDQPFPYWFSSLLIGILPPLEIIIAVLVFIGKTTRLGLQVSLCLLIIFTIYVTAIVIHLIPIEPCPCGGMIRELTWPMHLIFNAFFIAINIIGLLIHSKLNLSKLQIE